MKESKNLQLINVGPITHIISAAAFGGVGYGVYHMERRQYVLSISTQWGIRADIGIREVLLAERKKGLQENRDKENAEYAARKAESS